VRFLADMCMDDGVLTTFNSYGTVATVRQREIMQDLAKPRQSERPDVTEFDKAVALQFNPP